MADPQLARLGAALLDRITELAERMAAPITAEVSFYRDFPTVSAAEALFCHPNTVRHRLRRITAATGRSLTAPRDVAELCLALEASRLTPSS